MSEVFSWIFKAITQPSNFLFLILFISGYYYLNYRSNRSKYLLIFSSLTIILIGASPLVIYMAIPLEEKYQSFHNTLHAPEYAGIISLAGAQSVQKSAYHGQVNFSEHGERLTETVKLANLLPKLKILLSGGIIKSNTSESRIALQFFTEMGIDPKRIILEEKSRTTYTNASETQKIIKNLKNSAGKPWLLVTSAYHMPRSVAVFKKQNINIHPYPVDYYTRLNYSEVRMPDFGRNLRNFDHIAHEWAGLLVYYLSGKTDEIFPDIAPPAQDIKKAPKN